MPKSKYGARVTGEKQYIPEENPRIDRLRALRAGVTLPSEMPFSGGPNDVEFPPQYGEGLMKRMKANARNVYMECVKKAELVKGGYLSASERDEVRELVEQAFKDGGVGQEILADMKRRVDRGLPTESPWKAIPASPDAPPKFKNIFSPEMLRSLEDIPNLKRKIGGSFPDAGHLHVEYPAPVDDGLTQEQREILAGMEG